MRAIKYMDKEVVVKRGMEALLKELGPVEAIRFVNLLRKRIESVKRHRDWQKLLDKEHFFDEVFAVK